MIDECSINHIEAKEEQKENNDNNMNVNKIERDINNIDSYQCNHPVKDKEELFAKDKREEIDKEKNNITINYNNEKEIVNQSSNELFKEKLNQRIESGIIDDFSLNKNKRAISYSTNEAEAKKEQTNNKYTIQLRENPVCIFTLITEERVRMWLVRHI